MHILPTAIKASALPSPRCRTILTNFARSDLCEVVLPTSSRPNKANPLLTDYLDAPYFLTYYRSEITVENEISRFLHKNTFGPTKEEIDTLKTRYNTLRGPNYVPPNYTWEELTPVLPVEIMTELDQACSSGKAVSSDLCERLDEMVQDAEIALEEEAATLADSVTTSRRRIEVLSNSTTRSHAEAMAALQLEWVTNQMDPTTFESGEFTSLRKYWRRRLNARKTETYRIGESGPHACEKYSRWRKFAFTKADVQVSARNF